MSVLVNIAKRFIAPALPKPTQEYSLSYMDNFVNILRIYFNQLDNLLKQLTAIQTAVPVADLPTPSTALIGARYFVTDSNSMTFAAIVAAGGANRVPVYCDGVNWRIG